MFAGLGFSCLPKMQKRKIKKEKKNEKINKTIAQHDQGGAGKVQDHGGLSKSAGVLAKALKLAQWLHWIVEENGGYIT